MEGVGPSAIRFVASMPHLRSLRLANLSNRVDLSPIKSLDALELLDVIDQSLPDPCILQQTLKQLSLVRVERVAGSTADWIDALGHLTVLVALELVTLNHRQGAPPRHCPH